MKYFQNSGQNNGVWLNSVIFKFLTNLQKVVPRRLNSSFQKVIEIYHSRAFSWFKLETGAYPLVSWLILRICLLPLYIRTGKIQIDTKWNKCIQNFLSKLTASCVNFNIKYYLLRWTHIQANSTPLYTVEFT